MSRIEVFHSGQWSVITKQLNEAKSFVLVAVAYFTDASLFDLLVKKAKEGIRVELIVLDDDINTVSGIDYSILKSLNGDFSFSKNIHNKFCVIDGITILSGSYNWTNKAKLNSEDLTLIDGNILMAAEYIINFFKIKDPSQYIRRAILRESYKSNERNTTTTRIKRQSNLHKKLEEYKKGKLDSSKQDDKTIPPAS